MREYVVTLRHGEKVTVKAERVVRLDHQYLAFLLNCTPTIGDPDAAGETVALFDRGLVAAVVSREHLVSEERCEPIDRPVVVDAGDDQIPF